MILVDLLICKLTNLYFGPTFSIFSPIFHLNQKNSKDLAKNIYIATCQYFLWIIYDSGRQFYELLKSKRDFTKWKDICQPDPAIIISKSKGYIHLTSCKILTFWSSWKMWAKNGTRLFIWLVWLIFVVYIKSMWNIMKRGRK